MQGKRGLLVGGVVTAMGLLAGTVVALASGDPSSRSLAASGGSAEACRAGASSERTSRIDTSKLIIEYNSTDQDIGVHGAFDDHGWSKLCVFDPSGRKVLDVGPRGQLQDLTMAGIFFESREPPRSEFSFGDLKAAFPEGKYRVVGSTYDGKTLVGRATFTHDVPAPPSITSPVLAAEPKGVGNPVPLDQLTIGWDQVTETVSGDRVRITGYEVIVTKENHEDPHGFSRPIFDVHVGPSVRRLPVPAEYLDAGTLYEVELLALEHSGNQTISVGFIKTA